MVCVPYFELPLCWCYAERLGRSIVERDTNDAFATTVSRGNSVIPKSVKNSRIEENLKIVELSKEEVAELQKIHEVNGVIRYVYPSFGVNLGFPDKQASH